ncbi:peptidyl-tRNA hydrolase [Desulfocucumis palustris]|uniref:Peptidyl-tRNA hydrolase n=1 Tax=Desulfocucumis palustris TaxID=1898651 RepID=A0A2L2X9E6_9FIRM|nr:aminoacyl-tRNA hydrolase [Desulfocucumis palustris]GBF32859.1 peptidyl-tRNA hydrolase [Desulfocucumis palustris]
MFLIAGLGNPGGRYALTRHNVGFWMVDRLAGELNTKVDKSMFKSIYGEGFIGAHKVLLVKPQTYMNLSGTAVASMMRWYKLLPGELLVAYDDMDLPAGKIRIRAKGGHGGHRGMMSIIEQLGSNDFPRVRIGIGRPEIPGFEAADWVLGRFSDEEQSAVSDAVKNASEAVKCIVRDGVEAAMNKFNRS